MWPGFEQKCARAWRYTHGHARRHHHRHTTPHHTPSFIMHFTNCRFFTKNLRLRAGGAISATNHRGVGEQQKNAPKPICTLTKSEFFVPFNPPPHHTAVVKEGREGTGESDVRRGRWVCVRGDGGDEGEGREGEEWGGVERRGKDQMKHCSRRQMFGNSEISFPWWTCGLTSVKRFP